MTRFLTILFFITAISCQDKITEDKKTNNNLDNNWATVQIRVDNNNLFIVTNQDTSYYYENFEDSIYAKSHNGDLRTVQTKIIINKTQRDTIVSLALQSITNPVKPNDILTCSAGQYVKIALETNGTEVSCKYSSVGDWTKISPILFKLNEMTYNKIKHNK
jgi:hypothetical protein